MRPPLLWILVGNAAFADPAPPAKLPDPVIEVGDWNLPDEPLMVRWRDGRDQTREALARARSVKPPSSIPSRFMPDDALLGPQLKPTSIWCGNAGELTKLRAAR